MLQLTTTDAQTFIDQSIIDQVNEKVNQALQTVVHKSGEGKEWLGWQDLVDQPNDALLSSIETLASKIRSDADYFLVCGIGGSYLGAKAVIDALEHDAVDQPTIIYVGHQMSGTYLNRVLKKISTPKSDGSIPSVYLNVISKSGTTIEPALSFRVLRDWMIETYGKDSIQHRIICTTSASGGALNKVIDANGFKKFVIPDDVGGRFSVLTPVGLLPIAVAGIDIKALFYGAVEAYQTYSENPADVLNYVSSRLGLYESGFAIDVISSFEPELLSIGGWMQQLLGESEGKSGKGLYPAVHGYSTDLHSLGQMVQDGKRNLFETFLTLKQTPDTCVVPHDESNHDGLNYISGNTFHSINEKAYLGTREAHIDGGVPVIDIQLEHLSAKEIGNLIYFFELSTAVYVYAMDNNPFNQPGVEAYKKAMYRLLGK